MQGFQNLADVPPVLAVAPHVVIFVGPAFDLSPHRIAMTTHALALEEQFEIALPFGEPKVKRAYAMQALGLSLVCSTQRNDAVIADGEKLLDAVIEGAVKMYRKVEKTN